MGAQEEKISHCSHIECIFRSKICKKKKIKNRGLIQWGFLVGFWSKDIWYFSDSMKGSIKISANEILQIPHETCHALKNLLISLVLLGCRASGLIQTNTRKDI